MRCLSGFALLLACLALPLQAQRGGMRGGGGAGLRGGGTTMHGGFAAGGSRGFSSPGFRSGSSGLARPGFANTPRLRTAPELRSPYAVRTARPGFAPGVSSARPAFYSRSGAGVVVRPGGTHIPYRAPGRSPNGGSRYPYRGFGGRPPFRSPRFFAPRLGYPSYLSFGFFDPFFWGYDPFWDTDDWMGYDAAPYAAQVSAAPETQYPGSDDNPGQEQVPQNEAYPGQASAPQADANPEDAPGPWAPQAWTGDSPNVPAQERAVTLVFKDGRAPVRIRNYAMTRSAIFAGTDLREIPLDEIDLPATQKLNQASGVDFRLP